MYQIVITVVIWAALIVAARNLSEPVNNAASMYFISTLFPYFMLGRIIKQYGLHNKLFNNAYLFIAASVIWLFLKPELFKGASYMIGCSAIVVVMHICKVLSEGATSKQSKFKSLLLYIGKNTLYIYVFHYFFLEIGVTTYFINTLCQYSNPMMDAIMCIVPTILIVILSLAVKHVVEHEPLIMNYIFNKK